MSRWVWRPGHSIMTLRAALRSLAANEDLNFLLTNRIPRRLATRFIGWFSRIEQPLVRDASLAAWRLFTDLDLTEARSTRFRSMHDCFIRELREGARPVDPDRGVLVSPCDAIVGAGGPIAGTRLFQVKGFPYELGDLVPDAALVDALRDGSFVTLRLTSAMYHRFHAPCAATVESVRYVSGDTWNVNPIALKRIEALFTKNERACVTLRLEEGPAAGAAIVLVPVAAILVASLRFRFLDVDPRKLGDAPVGCHVAVGRGEEMGWFEHGSTIIVLAPKGFAPCEGLAEGTRIRMGERLMRVPSGPCNPYPRAT